MTKPDTTTEENSVKELGELIGYGNMMHIASKLWKEDMIKKGHPITGVFIPVLPCDIKNNKSQIVTTKNPKN